jgi:hypothetical protein
MKITRVQYTVQADFGEENRRNIAAVMHELRSLDNTDLKYATYLLDDGKTLMGASAPLSIFWPTVRPLGAIM